MDRVIGGAQVRKFDDGTSIQNDLSEVIHSFESIAGERIKMLVGCNVRVNDATARGHDCDRGASK